MLTKQELAKEIDKNKDFRLRMLDLNIKIREIKLVILEELKKHYETHWLNVDLKCRDAKIVYHMSKAKLALHEFKEKKLVEMIKQLEVKKESLDRRINSCHSRLEQFKKLDPSLLAEYRMLKDDLECQDMMIQISEGIAEL